MIINNSTSSLLRNLANVADCLTLDPLRFVNELNKRLGFVEEGMAILSVDEPCEMYMNGSFTVMMVVDDGIENYDHQVRVTFNIAEEGHAASVFEAVEAFKLGTTG